MTPNEQQLQEMIVQTCEWYDKKIAQIELILEKENESKILFQGEDGEKLQLPDEHKKGFFMGLQLALEVLGKFPINITNK